MSSQQPVFPCCSSMQLAASLPLDVFGVQRAGTIGSMQLGRSNGVTIGKNTIAQFADALREFHPYPLRQLRAPLNEEEQKAVDACLDNIVTVIGVTTLNDDPERSSKRWFMRQMCPWQEATDLFPDGPEAKGFTKIEDVKQEYRCLEHGAAFCVEIWSDMRKWAMNPRFLFLDDAGQAFAAS